jgi:hypothetical protein
MVAVVLATTITGIIVTIPLLQSAPDKEEYLEY